MFMDERQVSVDSALPSGMFQLRSFTGHEALSRPFRYVVELRSERDHIAAEQLLGTPMTVNLELSALENRQFTGFVTSFAALGRQGRYAAYRVVLEPWLSLMKLISNCRIIQDQAVPDIFVEVTKDLGIPVTTEMKLGGYPTRPYVVQYRETNFDFVSRLLEEEGIYYHFVHKDGQHNIKLVDGVAKHETIPGYESIPYYPPSTHARRDEDHISSWDSNHTMVPGKAALNDFDYQYKEVALEKASTSPLGHANDHFEHFDYPGGYVTGVDGQQAVVVTLERLQVERNLVKFVSNARGLGVGALFSVRGLAAVNETEQFLVLEASYKIESDALESSGEAASGMTFQGHFTAMSSKHEFRPERKISKPRMYGPHSAIVTGPPGVEIYTDPEGLGRVLVQFHWDRYGDSSKQNTSCWVRVSTPWAGAGFGGVQIPRVGEEVLVDFLDGDADRPVIVGRLYNGQNKPPYKLPDNATQSGIKTRSSPKGHADNFNEIRFEDRKGKEELHVQAERNHTVFVKHDQSITVGANRSVSVGKNETIAIQHERKTTVTKKDEQFYLDTRSIEVKKTDTLDVVELRTENFHGGRKVTVEKDDSEYVKDATQTVTIDKQFNLSAKEHIGLTQGGNSMMVKDSVTIKSVGDIVLTNGGCTITMGKDGSMTLNGKAQVKLKSGASSITMTPDGSVTIDGPLGVKMQTGTNSVVLSPAGADVKGAVVNVTGMGNVTVMAPIIKVG
ncbi:MAG: type VI secretion system tip protein TssI/VgrG [Deltaproteobacteria bacterium]|nr:type VI secretion system tip protein TssI/VgrG [Deltaproteobacteria bacterium]